VAESHLLPTLAPEDVGWRYLRTIETEGFTMRRGQTGLLTHYFLEIYAVWFQNDALFARLIDAPPESGAAWVPIETVRQCGTFPLTIDGARRDAAVNGYLLLEPGPEGR
jgi:hypothetical protein